MRAFGAPTMPCTVGVGQKSETQEVSHGRWCVCTRQSCHTSRPRRTQNARSYPPRGYRFSHGVYLLTMEKSHFLNVMQMAALLLKLIYKMKMHLSNNGRYPVSMKIQRTIYSQIGWYMEPPLVQMPATGYGVLQMASTRRGVKLQMRSSASSPL